MKKITTLLLAIAFVAISASATVTINVRTTTGEAPYLYTWGGASNGGWPGTQMDAESTIITDDGLVWLSQEFDCDALNIIFNDGGDPAIQTANINGVTGTAYYIFDPEEGEYEDVTSTYVEVKEFDPATLPETVVWVEGKEFAYFVAPATWTAANCWAWNTTTDTNFTGGTWPGQSCVLIGNTNSDDSAPVFQWIGPDIVPENRPEGIIFNNSTAQTGDMTYVAGGVYDLTGKLLYTVPEGGSEHKFGDVNCDGSVNAADVTALYANILNGDQTYIATSDVNGDNSINAADVTAVYRVILGTTETEE
jgi:hypothetical protein